jgi:hypothetical protein
VPGAGHGQRRGKSGHAPAGDDEPHGSKLSAGDAGDNAGRSGRPRGGQTAGIPPVTRMVSPLT